MKTIYKREIRRVIQLKIITHMSKMEMVLFRVQMLVKVIGLKLRLLIKEIVLPTIIATQQRFGIMAECLEFQPLFFVECISVSYTHLDVYKRQS